MKVLLLSFGSRGDVQPYMALGAALRARGHDVTLATGRGFETEIARHGLESAPLSIDVRALLQDADMRLTLDSIAARLRALRAFRPITQRLFDETWAIGREVAPDLIVYNVKMLHAPSLAEALGAVAVAAFQFPGFVATGAFPNPLLPLADLGRTGNRAGHRLLAWMVSTLTGRSVARFRRDRLGLSGPPRGPFEGYRPDDRPPPRLHAFSRHLVPPPDDWDAREAITGCWFPAPQADWRPDPSLERFLADGPPPVYVGFGSMPAVDGQRLTGIVVEALKIAGRRAILATGWGGLDPDDLPDSLHVLEAAPHDRLFPRCSAVVHHGGAGTTHEGLRWGRPSVICPVFGDQPFWGARVHALGAGPEPLPRKRLAPARLAEALAAAHEPAVAGRAAALGEAIRAEPGAAGAAELLDAEMAVRGAAVSRPG